MFESFAKTNRAGAAQLVSFQDLGEYMGAETLGLLRSSSTVSRPTRHKTGSAWAYPHKTGTTRSMAPPTSLGSPSRELQSTAYRNGQMTGQAGRISLTL